MPELEIPNATLMGVLNGEIDARQARPCRAVSGRRAGWDVVSFGHGHSAREGGSWGVIGGALLVSRSFGDCCQRSPRTTRVAGMTVTFNLGGLKPESPAPGDELVAVVAGRTYTHIYIGDEPGWIEVPGPGWTDKGPAPKGAPDSLAAVAPSGDPDTTEGDWGERRRQLVLPRPRVTTAISGTHSPLGSFV